MATGNDVPGGVFQAGRCLLSSCLPKRLLSLRRVSAGRETRNREIERRGVAQLAEHWFPKPGVASSIPAAPAISLSFSGF
jgi:hypothetical protein